MSLPDLFDYIDYRAFLSDWFEARKRLGRYSYAAFAEAGGCSKAALANVIQGNRTPRSTTLDAFARAIGLSPQERNYLGVLVELDAAPGPRRRREVMEYLLGNERFGQVRIADREPRSDIERYLEHWWILAVRELVSMPGFREDPVWIAETLYPRITPDQASYALGVLQSLDFVRRDTEGRLVCNEIRFATDPESLGMALVHFYREQIPRLLAGLNLELKDLQHYMGATVVFDEGSVPEAKAHLHQMVHQLATLGDARPPSEPARVYQVAVMMVPVTELVEGPEETGLPETLT